MVVEMQVTTIYGRVDLKGWGSWKLVCGICVVADISGGQPDIVPRTKMRCLISVSEGKVLVTL